MEIYIENDENPMTRNRTLIKGLTALSIVMLLFSFCSRRVTANLSPIEQQYFKLLGAMDRDAVCNKSSDLQFVGFWHIGGSNQATTFSRDDFVKKQLKEIQQTHLFNRCNNYNVKLNYMTTVDLSPQTKQLLSRDERIYELPPTNIENMKEEEEYFEFTTLMEMYSSCKNIPDGEDPVMFYIHSKTKNLWRLWMEIFLIGQECVGYFEDSTNMA